MNINAVGLDVLASELKKLGAGAPPHLLQTVEACQEACNSSLEVGYCCVVL